MDAQAFSAMLPGTPGYERLIEFNFLPSRYIHPQQAPALLPEAWCTRLAEGAASARIHAHLSTYLLQRLQIADAWIDAVDTFALKLALLEAPVLESLMFRLGLALLGRPIRQCIRREQIQQLDSALTPQDWDFVFRAAALDNPGVHGMESALFASPRETISGVGWAALQKLIVALEKPARVRFDVKMPPAPMCPLPALDEMTPEDMLIALSEAILDELDPTWDLSF